MTASCGYVAATRVVRSSLLALLCWLAASVVDGQPAGKGHRLGFLASGGAAASAALVEAFRDGLREQGWIEGRDVVVEYRFAEGRFDLLPGLADELVRKKVDLIFATPSPAAIAARNATSSIPIVMASVADPVGLGLVKSVARPGGNITGTTYSFDFDIFSKQLQLLKEAVPSARRVAVLSNAANPSQAFATRNVQAAARSLGLSVQLFEVRGPEDFDGVFARMSVHRPDALLVLSDSMFGTYAASLGELTRRHRLPSMHGTRSNVEAGGLIMYGPNIVHTVRQATVYVDKILRGARPAELPVEQPTKFDLVINLNTAKSLGLTIAPSLLTRADQVIR